MTVPVSSRASRRHALALCAIGVSAVLAAPAQPQRLSQMPCTEAPTFLLLTYPKAADKALATKAFDQMRQSVKDFLAPRKELCVVEKQLADETLRRSGYPVDAVLTTVDARALAATMRADEFLEFSAEQSAQGYQFKGRLVLARDEKLYDSVPLSPVGENMSQAARGFVGNLKLVRAQLEHEKKCYSLARDGKFAEAETEARAGIAAYPDAVISRLCLAVAMRSAKKSPDAVLVVAEEVLKRDPANVIGLQVAINAYFDKGDTTNYARVAGQFVTIDPGNPAVENIVSTLAAWNRASIALDYLNKALAQDADNPALLRLQFKLIYSANQWKEAAAKGEALAKVDTAAVDTLFVRRMAGAYAQDSQPAKVAEWLAKGAAKFPDNVGLAMALAQQLKSSGQVLQAIEAYKKVLGINPKAPQIRLYIADSYSTLEQTDSAFAWLRRAQEAGDDKEQIAGVAYKMGTIQLNAAQKSNDAEDFKKTIPFLAFADSVNAAPEYKFFWGFSAYKIAAALVTKMQPPSQPTCDVAKDARSWLEIANDKVRLGGKAKPDLAVTLMQGTGQYIDYVDKVLASLKCPPGGN